jgi:hypothetical protein
VFFTLRIHEPKMTVHWNRVQRTYVVHDGKRGGEVRGWGAERVGMCGGRDDGKLTDMTCCALFGGVAVGGRRGIIAPNEGRRPRRAADPMEREGGRRGAGAICDAVGARQHHNALCLDIDAPPRTMCGRSRGPSEREDVSADHEHARPPMLDTPVALFFRARAQSTAFARRHVLPAHRSPPRFKVLTFRAFGFQSERSCKQSSSRPRPACCAGN